MEIRVELKFEWKFEWKFELKLHKIYIVDIMVNKITDRCCCACFGSSFIVLCGTIISISIYSINKLDEINTEYTINSQYIARSQTIYSICPSYLALSNISCDSLCARIFGKMDDDHIKNLCWSMYGADIKSNLCYGLFVGMGRFITTAQREEYDGYVYSRKSLFVVVPVLFIILVVICVLKLLWIKYKNRMSTSVGVNAI